MKAKIDLEKFICSYVKWNNIQDALKDQGLICWNGEIVEISQDSEDEKIRKNCIHFLELQKTHHASTIEIDECIAWLEKQAQSTTITIPKDLKGTDTDGGVVGEKGEQPTNKNFKERYENIAKSDWFKKTHKDISIGGEQPTEEEMVGMGELGKAWFEKELLDHIDNVARRLHSLYSLLGHFLTDYNKKTDKVISLLQLATRETYMPPIIYKKPLDPDPNTLGGWETTASTEGDKP